MDAALSSRDDTQAFPQGPRGGYTVVVENKSGAAGRLATETLTGLPPDGNTLLLCPLGNLASARIFTAAAA